MRIVTYPSPVLKNRASEVDPSDRTALKRLVHEMAQTMYAEEGIGLAAPQIGVPQRVIVFDVGEGLYAVCNPTITDHSDDTEVGEEGCLSVPGINVPVERWVAVVCEGLTIDGEPVSIHAEGLIARVIQHEIDHLDGVVILDRATPEARKAAIRAYNEAMNV